MIYQNKSAKVSTIANKSAKVLGGEADSVEVNSPEEALLGLLERIKLIKKVPVLSNGTEGTKPL